MATLAATQGLRNRRLHGMVMPNRLLSQKGSHCCQDRDHCFDPRSLAFPTLPLSAAYHQGDEFAEVSTVLTGLSFEAVPLDLLQIVVDAFSLLEVCQRKERLGKGEGVCFLDGRSDRYTIAPSASQPSLLSAGLPASLPPHAWAGYLPRDQRRRGHALSDAGVCHSSRRHCAALCAGCLCARGMACL